MTIEERNNKLKHFITCLKCEVSGKCCDDNCSTQYDAGNMGEIIENLEAISKALEQEPTTKNNLGVDCVSRADVLKLMKDNWHTHNGDWAMQESMDDIRALPSVTPQEPKTGHWIYDDEYSDWFDVIYKCSCCKKTIVIPYEARNEVYKDYPYCHCGARMVDVQESEGEK